jgi:hypothetical protein
MAGRHSYEGLVLAPSGTGNVQLLAAPTLRRSIYVVQYTIVASIATVVKFVSGTTDITGPMSFAANGGTSPPFAGPDGWLFRTQPGEALVINQTVDGVDGHLTYYVA